MPNWQPQTPQAAQGQQGIQGVHNLENATSVRVAMQEFYDWQRTKTMDCMAEVKVLVDSYK